jgi:hypothetical protein
MMMSHFFSPSQTPRLSQRKHSEHNPRSRPLSLCVIETELDIHSRSLSFRKKKKKKTKKKSTPLSPSLSLPALYRLLLFAPLKKHRQRLLHVFSKSLEPLRTLIPVTHSNMNAIPSRWCGLSQRVSIGSTMMRARGEEEVVANVEATPLPPPSTAAFSGSSHRHRGSPGGGPSSPLSPTVWIATSGTGNAGAVEALNLKRRKRLV